ncbi:MAG TPA: NUDIX hydrolase [Thermoanaerobaculia bacterium]|nr:NUDIX hydrolase [Thermoanaerobaculia bacterium]
MRRWRLVARGTPVDYRVFRVRQDRVRSPRTARDHDVVVLDAPNWVNVVAVTEDRRVVLVRQFRHGTRETTLEIPGGAVDPGDRSPLAAAKRELKEETGYVSRRWRRLGLVEPNPAIQSNLTWTFLAEGARRAGAAAPAPGEELEVVLVPEKRLDALARRGVIRHALVIAAFYWKAQDETSRRLRSP